MRTGLRVDVSGDLYDEAFAVTQLAYDDQPAHPERMRRVLSGDALVFRKPKFAIVELVKTSTLSFGFVPFASPLTTTSFDLRGLRDALHEAAPACSLPETAG